MPLPQRILCSFIRHYYCIKVNNVKLVLTKSASLNNLDFAISTIRESRSLIMFKGCTSWRFLYLLSLRFPVRSMCVIFYADVSHGHVSTSTIQKEKSCSTCLCCLCVCAAGPGWWCAPTWACEQDVGPHLCWSAGCRLPSNQWSAPPPREGPAPLIYLDATCTGDAKKGVRIVTGYNLFTSMR